MQELLATLKGYALPDDERVNPFFFAGRVAVYIGLLLWGAKFTMTPMGDELRRPLLHAQHQSAVPRSRTSALHPIRPFYDHTLAHAAYNLGILLMMITFAWGAYLLYRQYQNLDRT